jgi:hypothetical protein
MYHVQARTKPSDPQKPAGEFKNVTLVAVSLEAAKARMTRLRLADPYREYRVCSDRVDVREDTP